MYVCVGQLDQRIFTNNRQAIKEDIQDVKLHKVFFKVNFTQAKKSHRKINFSLGFY